MSKFTKGYFTMKEEDAVLYSKEVLKFFEEDAELICKEIGDGNLNYIFKVYEDKSGKSVIIKQAGPVARISDEFKLSPDRNRIESEILKLQGEIAKGLTPEIYSYDPIMNCCAMEDLSDHTILRTALMQHKKFPKLAEDLSEFLAKTLLLTSDVVMNHKEKKELVKNYINPELCEISEDLVYTEPFWDCPRNIIFEPVKDFVKKELWEDSDFQIEVAKLKFDFMNKTQSLIHGDLHSGSIFVKEDSTKIIDPEFAFYGPGGYDVGNSVAHFIFTIANGEAMIQCEDEKKEYLEWVRLTIRSFIDLFKDKFIKIWDEKATEKLAFVSGYREIYLNELLKDSAGVAGLEICRRIIGLASVKDITSIEDAEKRTKAEKFCLSVGKELIMRRNEILEGKDYLDVIDKYF